MNVSIRAFAFLLGVVCGFVPATMAAPTASSASPAAAVRTYPAKSGDTLASLARQFGISIRQLQAANHLETETELRPGQSLKIPAPASLHSRWKAEGRQSTVYLLGSVHALTAEDYPLPRVIEGAFTNAAIVAFEADIEALETLETQQKIMSKAMLPPGETLKQQLSPEVYSRLAAHLHESGLSPEMFATFKPSMAAFLLVTTEMLNLGLEPQYGLDKHFFRRSREEHKQLEFLETVDLQIGMVTDFTKEEGELMLKTELRDMEKMKKELPELVRAWEIGDARVLEKLLNEAVQEAPVIFKRLLTDRNRRWMTPLEGWLRGDRNVLMVVGAGHLVGSEGLVELLRKK